MVRPDGATRVMTTSLPVQLLENVACAWVGGTLARKEVVEFGSTL